PRTDGLLPDANPARPVRVARLSTFSRGDVIMKKPRFLLKLAAAASSLVLIGGFVAYSAGAFDWLMNRAAPAADSDDESLATTMVDPWLKPAPRTYMGGSKYGVIVNVPKTENSQ